MTIDKMSDKHTTEVIEMMREFYASPAVSTNGSEEIFKNDVENCINDNPYLEGYVFIKEERIIGYAMLAKSFSTEFGKPCVWIEDIYFKAEYRGHGFGTRFLNFVTEKYKDSLLRLEVEEDNRCAVHTYRKNGFSSLPYMELKK